MDKDWVKNYPSAEGLVEDSLDENTSLKQVIRLVGKDKKVVDFGCATGYLASLLQQNGCTITGVEINPEAAKVSEKYCRKVVVADLDFTSVLDILHGESFDVAVFGDVLEHLRNPWKILQEVKSLINPDGYIVVSIPNVAHGAVRLSLLKGEFNYEEFGILDETHLRFFTRDSIQKMLTSTGYLIDEWRTTKSDIFLGPWIPTVNKVEFDPFLINQILAEENSDVLQFIVKAMPEPLENRLQSMKALFKGAVNDLEESTLKLRYFQEELLKVKAQLQSTQSRLEESNQRIVNLCQQNIELENESTRYQKLLVVKDGEFQQLQHHFSEALKNIELERQSHQEKLNHLHEAHRSELVQRDKGYEVEVSEVRQHLAETFRNIEIERFYFHQQREALRQGEGIPATYFMLKKGQRWLSRIMGRPINKNTLKSIPSKLKQKLRLPTIKRKFLKLTTKVQEQVLSSPHKELLARTGITPQIFIEAIASFSPPQISARSTHPPRISILTPTWNSSLDWFLETALSVLNQTYDAWEWCIVDDGSQHEELRELLQQFAELHPQVKVVLAESGGISAATNQAMAIATGEYICFLDHDDTLTPSSLEILVGKLDEGFDIVYSDEDKIDFSGKRYVEPFYKPSWSPEYFRGVMYVGHLLGVRKELAETVGGVRSDFDGVQDYDLVLRLSEKTAKIGHVPQILYHWRKISGSISGDVNAKSKKIEQLQQLAVNEHLKRLGLPGQAEAMGFHRLKIVPPMEKTTYPLISIIIPSKDAPDYLERCLNSLFKTSSYPNFEVILVDNETTDRRALSIIETHVETRNLKCVPLSNPFNYSRANNIGVADAQGEYLVFLNNDTEVITTNWLEHMLYYAEQDSIGAVGALLLFPDRTVQHAGCVMGFRGTADHIMRDFPADSDGYAGSLCCAREVSAVTAACLMVKRTDFEEVGGFNEHFFTHYQDVDLCLKLTTRGKTNIFTPRAVLIHHESKTRKDYYDWGDRLLLLDQFEDYIIGGDPYYNPNFDLKKYDYSIKVQ
ncbi:MAG: glycosyltransferase [Synechococcales cyanobacterium CRU_2_2]|nr:glycosyltransferase [Synechococcales cyanobacterium CRU_2_2]